MTNGFVGNASNHHIATVKQGLSSASAVHSMNPFGGAGGGRVPPPSMGDRMNMNSPHSPMTAVLGGVRTGIGNRSNVVVEQGLYNEVLQRILTTDIAIAEELHAIMIRIEEMCETIYIVPETLPKYLDAVNKLKSSLGEFQSLTNEARVGTERFVGEIVALDNRR